MLLRDYGMYDMAQRRFHGSHLVDPDHLVYRRQDGTLSHFFDIDALKVVSQGVNTLLEQNPEMGVLVITHYQRLLNYIKPHQVSVMM